MGDNEFSKPTKLAVGALCAVTVPVGLALAFYNAAQGHVPYPPAFGVVLLGSALFLGAKVQQLRRGVLVSFGTRRMTEDQANAYRVGYWLMAIGMLSTFL